MIERHGPQIVQDRARLTGLLRDAMMNEHRPLLSMLQRTLDEDVPATLLRSTSDARPYRVVESDLIARVVTNTLSDPAAVTWAVRAWARALGVGPAGAPAVNPQGEVALTEPRESGDQKKQQAEQKPPPPWYRTRVAAIAGGLVAVAIVAFATDVSLTRAPDANPTVAPTVAATDTPAVTPTRIVGPAPRATIDLSVLFATRWTCPMQNPVLADSFLSRDKAWGAPRTGVDISGGYFNITPNKNSVIWVLRDGRLGNVTLCTEVFNTAFSAAAAQTNSGAGLAFWSAYLRGDPHPTIYAFFISPSAIYGVWRLEHQQWAPLLREVHSDAIRTGSAASNVLTVVTQGDDASFYINGSRVGSIHNTQRRGPFGGLIAETSAGEQSAITWRFRHYAYR